MARQLFRGTRDWLPPASEPPSMTHRHRSMGVDESSTAGGVRAEPPEWSPPRGWPPPPEPAPRRRLSRRFKIKLTVAVVVLALVFRRALIFGVVSGLSASLHLVGVNLHLPHVTFGWPWTSVTTGSTTNVDLGPWVLQNIEGISKPALGTENFDFMFTHTVSKNVGFLPCWYSATFYAVGRASATVDLNPGSSWWAPSTGHYRLQVLTRPAAGRAGSVAVDLTLPLPQLPQSVHDVSIDTSVSKPVSTQHSWTYPGFGCGVLLRPQFAESVLYQQAQSIAFDRVVHDTAISDPLITAAEQEATSMIKDNFIQPTVNQFGYTLNRFAITWSSGS